MQISATLHVKSEVAATFPQRPDRVREAMTAAEAEMRSVAAERHRRLSEPPRLTDMRDTKLGFVEMTFLADTVAE